MNILIYHQMWAKLIRVWGQIKIKLKKIYLILKEMIMNLIQWIIIMKKNMSIGNIRDIIFPW